MAANTLRRNEIKSIIQRFPSMKKSDVIYDDNVDYDALEQHTYEDSGDDIFYTCPICGGEYLATFITEEDGQTMCIDCWSKRYGK